MESFYKYFNFLFFFILGFITISIVVAMTFLKNIVIFYIFNIIGSILLETFSFLSFYLILYPLVNWYAYKRNFLTFKFAFNWTYTIVFFLTLTALIKINEGNVNSAFLIYLVENFGSPLSILLLSLIFSLEVVFLFHLNIIIFNDSKVFSSILHFFSFKFKTLLGNLVSFLNLSEEENKEITFYNENEVKGENNSELEGDEIKILWGYNNIVRKKEPIQQDLELELKPLKVEPLEREGQSKIVEERLEDEHLSDESVEREFLEVFKEESPFYEDDESDAIKEALLPNVEQSEREEERVVQPRPYKIDLSIFKESDPLSFNAEDDREIQKQSRILKETLKEFNITADLVNVIKGPVVTMYAIRPAKGVKLTRITSIVDNITFRLAAERVRIIAPIPGQEAVGIEVPNKTREPVLISQIFTSQEFEKNYKIPFALGKGISGDNIVIDLSAAPHLLIAGATGAGKSVCVNSLIASILVSKSPDEVKLIMIDPKIVELKLFNDIPHLLTPVVTDVNRALEALKWCLDEMERRYFLLDNMQVRDINSYNKKIENEKLNYAKLPYLVIIIDEFADLILSVKKELENVISRLAAMARAIGIHLVLATQRPSVDVITGVIKANFPSRISFMVASSLDSRIILGSAGAEQLLGKGDMLYMSPTTPFPVRIQGGFLDEREVFKLVEEVKKFGEPNYIDDEIFIENENQDLIALDTAEEPLFEEALEIVRGTKKASASYLQRRLKIGYNRAARIIELMEEMGYIGPQNGSKPRDVY